MSDALATERAALKDTGGITDEELAKVKNQMRARLVFENDSVTTALEVARERAVDARDPGGEQPRNAPPGERHP